MAQFVRRTVIAAATCGLLMLAANTTMAQTTQPANGEAPKKGAIIGIGTFTSFVENMDRSLAFYHDVFGMDVPALPESGARPYNPTNLQLYAMFGMPGARERHQSAQIKGTNVRVEIMEVQDVPHKTVPLRIQDPGAATLVFIVRDVDALLAHVTQAKAEVVTPGGKPVQLADGARSILMRDIDGRFIELRQPATLPEGATATTNGIVDLRLSLAVADLAHTTQVYRDVFGFTVAGETPVVADKALRALTGLKKAKVRRSTIQAPGSQLQIELVEYSGVDRRPLSMNIVDRGAARLQLRAENVDDLVVAINHAGLKIASDGGVASPIPPNFKGVLVADPNNFFLTPFAPCQGCAPTLQRGPGQSGPAQAH